MPWCPRTPRRIAFARLRPLQRRQHFGAQQGKIALHPALAANQHVVGIGQAMRGQQFAHQRAQPPLHAVAHHGVADLLGDGDAETQTRPVVGAGKQDKPGPRNAQAPVGGEEIGAPRQNRGLDRSDQAESFLRPRARRARRTLRPPTVALRARKP